MRSVLITLIASPRLADHKILSRRDRAVRHSAAGKMSTTTTNRGPGAPEPKQTPEPNVHTSRIFRAVRVPLDAWPLPPLLEAVDNDGTGGLILRWHFLVSLGVRALAIEPPRDWCWRRSICIIFPKNHSFRCLPSGPQPLLEFVCLFSSLKSRSSSRLVHAGKACICFDGAHMHNTPPGAWALFLPGSFFLPLARFSRLIMP